MNSHVYVCLPPALALALALTVKSFAPFSRSSARAAAWLQQLLLFFCFVIVVSPSTQLTRSTMGAADEEKALVIKLIVSLPSVFAVQGTPDDLNFILSHLKQAVCYRGISTKTQKLLVALLVPLSSFKAGFMDVKELKAIMGKSIKQDLSLYRKVGLVSTLMVSTSHFSFSGF